MAEYKATILWNRGGALFTDNLYSRGHVWQFDGGVEVRRHRRPMSMTQVTLRPAVVFGGSKVPNSPEIEAMHHESHEQCFIANSVNTEVRCEPAPCRLPPVEIVDCGAASTVALTITDSARPVGSP